MIKFFRKIRYDFIQKNKTSKYLKYAIGEIILVVIGILIAIQINNWNEKRKNYQEEVKILRALEKELLESQKRIDETIDSQRLVVDRNITLCELLMNNREIESIDSIPDIFNWGALVFFRAEPVTGTYDALIGAGKTVLIQNEELNKLLAEYSAEIKMGYEDHEYGMIMNQIILEKTMGYNGPLLGQTGKKKDNKQLKDAVKLLTKDNSIIGIISKKQGVEKRRLNWQKSLSKQIDVILEIIAEELL